MKLILIWSIVWSVCWICVNCLLKMYVEKYHVLMDCHQNLPDKKRKFVTIWFKTTSSPLKRTNKILKHLSAGYYAWTIKSRWIMFSMCDCFYSTIFFHFSPLADIQENMKFTTSDPFIPLCNWISVFIRHWISVMVLYIHYLITAHSQITTGVKLQPDLPAITFQ